MINMPKKLFILLLVFMLLISGCGRNTNNDNSDAVSGSESSGETSSDVSSDPVDEYAKSIISEMSLEEKVGQLFFVRLRKDMAIDDINTYHVGGFIMYAIDFENEDKASVTALIAGFQAASKLPLLIGVDEEGGTVTRVSRYSAFRDSKFLSPQELYNSGGFEQIKSDTIEKSRLLLGLGINVNLAPVADVSTNPTDFIYQRSLGKDAHQTAEYVKTVVTVMKNENIGSVIKHFPGYGNNEDTHTGIAIDERDYNTFVNSDFIPFTAGIENGTGAVMISHNVVKCMDGDKPASLSEKVIGILRNDLGFDGVVMCDDLGMDAIKKYTGDNNAAVLAVMAGNDMLLGSNFVTYIPAVIKAVEDGVIPVERIDEAVLRVLKWKISLGLIKIEN